MRKNPHGKILGRKLNEQYLSTIPKSCPKINKYKYLFKVLIYFSNIHFFGSFIIN